MRNLGVQLARPEDRRRSGPLREILLFVAAFLATFLAALLVMNWLT